MGCGSCAAAAAARKKVQAVKQKAILNNISQPCPYTNTMLLIWREKLKWFKRSGKSVLKRVATTTINKHLGVVISSLNINDKCRYKSRLDEVAKLITVINGLE